MSLFAENIVNQRFRLAYEAVIKNKHAKNKSELAEKLGTYSHVVNLFLKGERNITVDQLNKFCELYHIDANYMFGFTEHMFLTKNTQTGDLVMQLTAEVNGTKHNIIMVPRKASAGYAMNPGDWSFLETLHTFSIPGLDGDLLAFEISGDSMTPTITNGDVVICEPLERGEPIRDNQVYVVVTDVVVAKRIQQVRSGSDVTKLRMISDNGDVYLPYEVEPNEVQQILRVKCRLTNYAIA